MPSFDFSPTQDARDSFRLLAVSEIPGCEEATATFDGPVLALHLGSPARVYQRRASRRFDTTFHAGQLSLIPASCDTSCSTPDRFSFLHLQWGSRFLAKLGARELPNLHFFEDATTRTLLESMLKRATDQGAASRLYLDAAALVLAERMLELAGEGKAPSARGLSRRAIAQAEEYFRAHMSANPSMARVAASIGLGVRHFTRSFKRATGVSPHRYFDALRVERARALLARPASRVLDVAFELGFANPSHFAAFFQRATGHTPLEFKRKCAP
jgi:AraC family transcriptional regulator